MKKHIQNSMVVLVALTLVVATPAYSHAKGKGNGSGNGGNGGGSKGGSSRGGFSNKSFSGTPRNLGNGGTSKSVKSNLGAIKNPAGISNQKVSPIKGSTVLNPGKLPSNFPGSTNLKTLPITNPNLTKLNPITGTPIVKNPIPGTLKPLPPGTLTPLPPGTKPLPPCFPPLNPAPPKPCPPKYCPGFTFTNWCVRPFLCHWWWKYCPPLQYGYYHVDCHYDYVNTVVVVDGMEVTVRYWLGVKGMVLPGKGFGVEEVERGSPAEVAGIRPGMVITDANGIQISDDNAMQLAINNAVNGVLHLTIIDKVDAQPLQITVQMQRIVLSGF